MAKNMVIEGTVFGITSNGTKIYSTGGWSWSYEGTLDATANAEAEALVLAHRLQNETLPAGYTREAWIALDADSRKFARKSAATTQRQARRRRVEREITEEPDWAVNTTL